MTSPPFKRSFVRWILSSLAVILMMLVGLLLMAVSLMTSPATMDPATEHVTDLGAARGALTVLLLFTLPWFRKAPWLLLIAGTISAVVLMTDPFVLAVGLTVWIVRCVRTWQWVVAGAGVAVILVNGIIHLVALQHWPDEDYRSLGRVLVVVAVLACLGLVFGISLWARQKRSAQLATARAHHAQANTEQLSDELVRQREREELAREVHDTLAGRLSALSLHHGSLVEKVRRENDPELADALENTRGYADQALTDLRTLLVSLREGGSAAHTPSSAPGGIADVQDLLDDAAASGLQVQPFILLDSYDSAPDAVQRAVVRVTGEALTNALRHSSDQRVHLRLQGGPGRGILLEFTNHYDADTRFEGGSGTGLIGLRERVDVLGGVVAEDYSDTAYTLTVRLPWAAPPAASPAP